MAYEKVVEISKRERDTLRATASCFVYVLTDGRACKIGIASNPRARLAKLRVGNPHLELVEWRDGGCRVVFCASHSEDELAVGYPFEEVDEAREAEKIAHALLAEFAVGGEWFSVSPDVAKAAVGHANRLIQQFSEAMDLLSEKINDRN